MHLTSLLLPTLAVAQGQIPFLDQAKEYFAKGSAIAESYLADATNAFAAATDAPKQAASSAIAGATVHHLNFNNWEKTIKHSGKKTPYNSPEAWMVYVHGENKTCLGMCERANRAWNESVALFASDVSAPYLADINCEHNELLCGAWLAEVPSIYLFIVPNPAADQSAASTTMYFYPMNFTSVTSADITTIHTRKTYLQQQPYTGAMHPFDGWVARFGILKPMSVVLFYFGKIPSWLMMITVTFFTRNMMTKKLEKAKEKREAEEAKKKK